MNTKLKSFGWFLILAAGVFWGTMGIFLDILTDVFGFTTLQAAFFRISSAALMFFVLILVTDKKRLKVCFSDLPLFLAMGIFSILAMTCFYFLSIQATSYSVAAILLYTAPIMVSIMSAIFFKEHFGKSKIIALLIAFSGCVLMSGLSVGGKIKIVGILYGLLSGFAYALYSIFGKIALKKYHPFTISFYAFMFACFGAAIVCDLPGIIKHIPSINNIGYFIVSVFLTGLVTAFLPFLLYTLGLETTEAGKASIIASIEPLSATVCGLFSAQQITMPAALGMISILLAIVIVSKNDASR